MEFVNTNQHRIYLAADDGSKKRVSAGQAFDVDGQLADIAKGTNGVVTKDDADDQGFEYQASIADGRAAVVHDDSVTPGAVRTEQVGAAAQVARQFVNQGNSDRYTGKDGSTVATPPGTPVLNAPDVGFPSTGAGSTPAEQLIPADDSDSGAPAEGGLYDQPTEDLVGLSGQDAAAVEGGYTGDGAATVAGGAEAGDGQDGDGGAEVNSGTDANGKPLDQLTKAELTEIGVSEGVLSKSDLDGKGKAKATNKQLVKDIKDQREADANGALTSDQVPAAQ